MTTAAVAWPAKTRELHTVLVDSTRWNGFKFRDGDIIIATWGKSGTTWTQQIVGQLVFQGAEGMAIAEGVSPWLDLRLFPVEETFKTLEAQTHRALSRPICPWTPWSSLLRRNTFS